MGVILERLYEKYPEYKSWDKGVVLANLMEPAKFRRAFSGTEWERWSDEKIKRAVKNELIEEGIKEYGEEIKARQEAIKKEFPLQDLPKITGLLTRKIAENIQKEKEAREYLATLIEKEKEKEIKDLIKEKPKPIKEVFPYAKEGKPLSKTEEYIIKNIAYPYLKGMGWGKYFLPEEAREWIERMPKTTGGKVVSTISEITGALTPISLYSKTAKVVSPVAGKISEKVAVKLGDKVIKTFGDKIGNHLLRYTISNAIQGGLTLGSYEIIEQGVDSAIKKEFDWKKSLKEIGLSVPRGMMVGMIFGEALYGLQKAKNIWELSKKAKKQIEEAEKLLGVKKERITPEIIERAYRLKAKIYHPDRPTGNREMFEKITEAKNLLLEYYKKRPVVRNKIKSIADYIKKNFGIKSTPVKDIRTGREIRVYEGKGWERKVTPIKGVKKEEISEGIKPLIKKAKAEELPEIIRERKYPGLGEYVKIKGGKEEVWQIKEIKPEYVPEIKAEKIEAENMIKLVKKARENLPVSIESPIFGGAEVYTDELIPHLFGARTQKEIEEFKKMTAEELVKNIKGRTVKDVEGRLKIIKYGINLLKNPDAKIVEIRKVKGIPYYSTVGFYKEKDKKKYFRIILKEETSSTGRKWYSIFRIDRIDESVPVPARKPGTLGHLASTAVPSTRQDTINITTKSPSVKPQKRKIAKLFQNTLIEAVYESGGISPQSLKKITDYKNFPPGLRLLVVRKDGLNVDKMAQELEEAGILKTPPDYQADDFLVQSLISEWNNRKNLPKEKSFSLKIDEKLIESEIKQPAEEEQIENIPAFDLDKGDKFTLFGEEYEVVKKDPDTGAVTIMDGQKIEVDDGFDTVPIDKGSLKKAVPAEKQSWNIIENQIKEDKLASPFKQPPPVGFLPFESQFMLKFKSVLKEYVSDTVKNIIKHLKDLPEKKEDLKSKIESIFVRYAGLPEDLVREFYHFEEGWQTAEREIKNLVVNNLSRFNKKTAVYTTYYHENPEKYPLENAPEGVNPDDVVELSNLLKTVQDDLLDYVKQIGEIPDSFKGYYDKIIKALRKERRKLEEDLRNTPENSDLREQIMSEIEEINRNIDYFQSLRYVHHYVKNPNLRKRIYLWIRSGLTRLRKKPKEILGRKYHTIDDLKEAGFEVEDDARVIIARILRIRAELERNFSLLEAIKNTPEVCLKRSEVRERPECVDWVELPEIHSLAGYKLHPFLVDALRELFWTPSYKTPIARTLGKLYRKINIGLKLAMFFKPFVIIWNDLQQLWLGTGFKDLFTLPVDLARAVKIVLNKTELYKKFEKEGLYNREFNLYKELVEEQVKRILERKETDPTVLLIRKTLERMTNPTKAVVDYYKNINEITWTSDEILRTTLALTYMRNGFTIEEAVKRANMFMAHYNRLPKSTKYWLNNIMLVGPYRTQMIRLYKEIAKESLRGIINMVRLASEGKFKQIPAEFKKKWWAYRAIIKWLIWKLAVANLLFLLGYAGGFWGYRFGKRVKKKDKEYIEFISLTGPIFDPAKYANRPWYLSVKYNLARLPSMFIELLVNKGWHGKQIYDPFSDKKEQMKDIAMYIFEQSFPMYQEVKNLTDPQKDALRKILQFFGIAWTYRIEKMTLQQVHQMLKEKYKGKVPITRRMVMRMYYKQQRKYMERLKKLAEMEKK